MRIAVGIALGLTIGGSCRYFEIPLPAPPALVGALLVLAMTVGYLVTDRMIARPATTKAYCGGPTGDVHKLPS